MCVCVCVCVCARVRACVHVWYPYSSNPYQKRVYSVSSASLVSIRIICGEDVHVEVVGGAYVAGPITYFF